MKNPEHTTLHQLAGELALGEPVLAGELAVLPLFLPGSGGESSRQPEPYILLDEALPCGLVEVVEIGAGHVPEILVRNRGASPVLILEGDHLVGAKQNRAVWITILVPGKSETVIPVSCLEQGRWRYNTPGAAGHRRAARAASPAPRPGSPPTIPRSPPR